MKNSEIKGNKSPTKPVNNKELTFMDEYALLDDELTEVSYKRKNNRRDTPSYDRARDTGMTRTEKTLIVAGVAVAVLGIAIGVFLLQARAVGDALRSFASVGSTDTDLTMIGMDGIAAVEQAVYAGATAATTETVEPEETFAGETIHVDMVAQTIKGDLKIKFLDRESGRLIEGVPFAAQVTDPSGAKEKHTDEDKNGIIHLEEIDSGIYVVEELPVEGEDYRQYEVKHVSHNVTVSNVLAYVEIDVSDEIKDRSEINVAEEDNMAENDTPEEGRLEDTTTLVESSKTQVSGGTGYVAIDKSEIADPYQSAKAGFTDGRFRYLNDDTDGGVAVTSANPANPPDTGVSSDANTATDADGGGSNTENAAQGVTAGEAESTAAENNGNYTGQGNDADATSGNTDATNGNTDGSTGSAGNTSGQGAGDANTGNTGGSGSDATGQNGGSAGSGQTTGNRSEPGNGGSADSRTGAEHTEPETNTVTSSPVTSVTMSAVSVVEGKEITLAGKDLTGSDGSIIHVDGNTVTGIAPGVARVFSADGSMIWDITVTPAEPQVNDNADLKDKQGRQVYVRDGEEYRRAVNSDYRTYSEFYVLENSGEEVFRYTGWQTVDGKTRYYDQNGNMLTGSQVISGVKYTFDDNGALVSGTTTLGIDVSEYNGAIDWGKVKDSGVSFAIIRLGYRGWGSGVLVEDARFRQNMQGAINNGIRVGVYFVTQAVNEVEAVEEASMVLGLIRNYSVSYPVFLDVETSGGRGQGRADSISVAERTAVCDAFCRTVANGGYRSGVYANKTWLDKYIDTPRIAGYNIWVAQYHTETTYTRTKYDMWQYTSSGSVAGIGGKVDMNISYTAY